MEVEVERGALHTEGALIVLGGGGVGVLLWVLLLFCCSLYVRVVLPVKNT